MDLYMGTIIVWPIGWAPEYFSLCQGQELLVNQYQAIYSLLGQTFGGNGSTTFKLPNLSGRTPIGAGIPPWTATPVQVAQTYGSSTGTIALTTNNLPPHSHAATFVPSTGPQAVTLPAVPPSGSLSASVNIALNAATSGTAVPPSAGNAYLGGWAGKVGSNPVTATGPYDTTKAAATSNLAGVSASISSAGYSSGSPAVTTTIQAVTGGQVAIAQTGLGQPFSFNNMQPSLVMNFLIAMQGLYPVRQ
jgi:microcystin-dependent protein